MASVSARVLATERAGAADVGISCVDSFSMKASAILLPRLAFAALLLANRAFSETPAPHTGRPAMDTPIEATNIDTAAFAQWVDGGEKLLTGAEQSHSAQWVIWTNKTQPGHSGVTFGDSKTPGVRHLRIGFKNAVAPGSILVRAGGQLSVLKAGAAYPGNLNSDADWIPAQRPDKGNISVAEVAKTEIALWTLPPDTRTRALRFTHVAEASDASYAGFLGGVFVMNERWVNLAPQAFATARANAQDAPRINNGVDDTDKPWDNLDKRASESAIESLVSPHDPQWVMLSWPAPVEISGLNALSAGFGAAEIQAYAGPGKSHPRDADETDWETIGNFAGVKNGYPIQLWPSVDLRAGGHDARDPLKDDSTK